MLATYKAFVDRMIQNYEGGYGWDKGDPGGPTKYGITCYDLAEHRGQKMDSMSRWAPIVKAMELSEAEQIYVTKYATAIRYNELPAGVDCVMMDYAVNSGESRPIRVAGAILNVPNNGRMTPTLLRAIKYADAKELVRRIDAERLTFMKGIRGGSMWRTFGHGWGMRVADLTSYSLRLAANVPTSTVIAPNLANIPTPKATHVDPHANDKGLLGAVAAGGPALALMHDFPWWALGVALAVVAAGAGIYLEWKRRSAVTANKTVVLP